MTRHARNSTAGSVYTYHERKKDASQSGYGSKNVRLGKDSVQEFDCCCLTLQPCKNPMITLDGVLFDKEAVLEYIIKKKKDISKQLKEYEKQKSREKNTELEKIVAEKEKVLNKFVARESKIVSEPLSTDKKTKPDALPSISNMSDEKKKTMPSFWLPSLTPQADATLLQKPDEKVRCPITNKPLKMKDLIEVKFTEVKDGSKKSLITKDARYVCPVTNDVLGNSVPCAVLRTSGSVVTMDCVEKLVKKEMVDPINGKPMTEKDIIPIRRGASGFSSVGLSLKAKKPGPAMQA